MSAPAVAVATAVPAPAPAPAPAAAPAAPAPKPKKKSRGCLKCCLGTPVFMVVVFAAFLASKLVPIYQSLAPGEPFALMRTHNASVNPSTYHSRYRGDEYTRKDRFFFQWWNFLVFDAETRDHFNIIYQLTDYAENSTNKDTASVGMGYLRDHTRVSTASAKVPLSELKIRNHFDFEINFDGRPNAFLQEAIDDNTYRIRAKFIDQECNPSAQVVEWDLTFHRVHGVYASEDSEEGNKGELCTMVSTLFGFNSEAEGTIKVGEKVFTITRTSRYRAYAAGSWGCQLPNGNPPLNYPWSWFWLVVPGVTSAEDVSMVMGTAKFEGGAVGDIYGGFMNVGHGKEVTTARMANIYDGSAFQTRLLSSASDGFLVKYDLQYDQWADYTDPWGTAKIPLRQTYRIETKTRVYLVDFHSRLEQYFRAPVFVEKDLVQRLFSDFRAVGVKTFITIKHRDGPGAPEVTVFEREIDTINALEFAYEPAIDIERFKQVNDRPLAETNLAELREAAAAASTAAATPVATPAPVVAAVVEPAPVPVAPAPTPVAAAAAAVPAVEVPPPAAAAPVAEAPPATE